MNKITIAQKIVCSHSRFIFRKLVINYVDTMSKFYDVPLGYNLFFGYTLTALSVRGTEINKKPLIVYLRSGTTYTVPHEQNLCLS